MFAAEPTSLDRRVTAAQATLDRFKGQTFAWGKFDCARMAAFHLRQLGHRPKMPAPGYRTARSAKLAIGKAGFADLLEALDAMGFARIPPAATIAGDIVAWPSEHPEIGALGVQLGNGRTLAYHPDATGAEVLQLSEWIAAWRVDPR